jgi:hypothetical protein
MYKPSTIWQLSDPSLRAGYEAMGSPVGADSLVMRLENQSKESLTESVGRLIGQSFCIALSEELQLRGFTAQRIAMRVVSSTERLRRNCSRTRVELDVIVSVPKMSQNDFIDTMRTTKEKSAVRAGANVKIILKAELETDSSDRASVRTVRSMTPDRPRAFPPGRSQL